MKHDEIQIWMLTAFMIVLAISLYKVYIIFSSPASGPSTETVHEELRAVIITFIKKNSLSDMSDKALFEALIQQDDLDQSRHKNFNLNRYYQLIQQLYYIYDVKTFPELIESINAGACEKVEKKHAP